MKNADISVYRAYLWCFFNSYIIKWPAMMQRLHILGVLSDKCFSAFLLTIFKAAGASCTYLNRIETPQRLDPLPLGPQFSSCEFHCEQTSILVGWKWRAAIETSKAIVLVIMLKVPLASWILLSECLFHVLWPIQCSLHSVIMYRKQDFSHQVD